MIDQRTLRFVPNAICIVRIVLVGPIVWLLLEERFEEGLALIVLAGLSDGLDGFLAKTFDWRTRLGGLLDPIADKLLVISVFLTLTWLDLVPFWLAVVVVLRDAVIIGGASAYQFLIAPVEGRPSAVSKINTAAQLVFVFAVLLHAAYGIPPELALTLLGATVFVTSVVSGMDYVITWSRRAWRHQRIS